MTLVAEEERRAINTREALAAAKERGKRLCGDRGNIREIVVEGRAKSAAVRRAMARERDADLASGPPERRRCAIAAG
jgi:hypothetical protein